MARRGKESGVVVVYKEESIEAFPLVFRTLCVVLLALLAFVLISSSAIAVDVARCCVPTTGSGGCFSNNTYTDQALFANDCTQVAGTIYSGVCNGRNDCKLGCCCATSTVPGADQINAQESTLKVVNSICVARNHTIQQTVPDASYRFSTELNPSDPTKDTCVKVCAGGGTTPPTPSTWKVSGTVTNASKSPAAPLVGVSVYIPTPTSQIRNTTNAKGEYTLAGVPAMSANVIAIHPACRPGISSTIVVGLNNKDTTGVNIPLDCSPKVCANSEAKISKPTAVPTTDNVTFTITYDDKCKDFKQYEIWRCDETFASCAFLPPQTPLEATSVVDHFPKAHTKYCYLANVRASDGNLIAMNTSNAAGNCVISGDDVCMHPVAGAPASWCGSFGGAPPNPKLQFAKFSCDQNNYLTNTACDPGQLCSMVGGKPVCASAPDCRKCDGILGLFTASSIASNWFITVPGSIQSQACKTLQACYVSTQDGDAADPHSSSVKMVDLYTSCLNIAGCTSYGSKDACNANVCKVGGPTTGGTLSCEWKEVSKELGKGICVNKNNPECSACSDVLGYCNTIACRNISNTCYYSSSANGLDLPTGCMSTHDIGCAFYATKDDCVGTATSAQDAQFDIHYDASGTRVGGTNARTTSSNDLLRIGACSWVAPDGVGRCIKNADNFFVDQTKKEDDCLEHGLVGDDALRCLRDSAPPNTSLYLLSPPEYSISALRTLAYTVTDNVYSGADIQTFFCFQSVKDTTPCYPNATMASITLPTTPGDYVVRYYSMDAAFNSEIVHNATLKIFDNGVPTLVSISLGEDRR